MGTVDDEHGTVDAAVAWLERRLPNVRARRERLESELAEAVREEQALHGALDGLRTLTSAWTGEPGENLGGALQTLPLADVVQPDASVPQPDDAAPGDISGNEPAVVSAEQDHTAPADSKDVAATAPTAEQGSDTAPGATKPVVAKKAPAKKSTAKKSVAKKTTARKTAAKAVAGKPARSAKKTAGAPDATQDAAAAPGQEPVARKAVKSTRAAKKTGAAVRTRVTQPEPSPVPARARRGRTSADSVLEALAGAAGPLRARDVVGVLGLESGATDAVRTMLERLAKAGRARKVARGAYAVADAV